MSGSDRFRPVPEPLAGEWFRVVPLYRGEPLLEPLPLPCIGEPVPARTDSFTGVETSLQFLQPRSEPRIGFSDHGNGGTMIDSQSVNRCRLTGDSVTGTTGSGLGAHEHGSAGEQA